MSYNINNQVSAAKMFAELDPVEDPEGMQTLGRVDFQQGGFYFPDKDYNSVKEAQQALKYNKRRIYKMMDEARYKQIDSFAKAVSGVVREDNAVVNMP